MQEQLFTWCQVFSILRAERFYAKPSKCQFFAPELEFVGFVVSATCISHHESNIKAVLEWPTSTSTTFSVSFYEFVVFTNALGKKITARWWPP